MRKPINLLIVLCLLFATNTGAKVLFVINSTLYNSGYVQGFFKSYVSAVNKIDHKDTSVVIYNYDPTTGNMHDRCQPLWRLLRDSCQANYNTTHPIEGVVFIGNLPMVWCSDNHATHTWGTEIAPDDRYFMDLFNINTGTFYTNANETAIWTFDPAQNIFTGYSSLDGRMDIWVSRIMAQQIRAARGPLFSNGLYAEDENEMLMEYFTRLLARMRAPAKVPARGFGMGGISSWADHDAVDKLGLTKLKLLSVFSFDLMESCPGNYLLQLTKGPYGGTTLGAYNGVRYADLGIAKNNITKTYGNTLRIDRITGNPILISSNPPDTFGYEWAGIYEHSDYWSHMFNMIEYQSPDYNGVFSSLTYGKQWSDANWLQPSGGYNNGSYFQYNQVYDNPYHTDSNSANPNQRGQFAIFKASIPTAGDYTIKMYCKADLNNTPGVYGNIKSVPKPQFSIWQWNTVYIRRYKSTTRWLDSNSRYQ